MNKHAIQIGSLAIRVVLHSYSSLFARGNLGKGSISLGSVGTPFVAPVGLAAREVHNGSTFSATVPGFDPRYKSGSCCGLRICH